MTNRLLPRTVWNLGYLPVKSFLPAVSQIDRLLLPPRFYPS